MTMSLWTMSISINNTMMPSLLATEVNISLGTLSAKHLIG